jgi:sigma-B regulation protein RsbU (phosphoserine phosphatase)
VRSNKLLFESTSPEKFVTLFYSILDPMKHELVYCNAGHDHPFLLSEGKEPVRLPTGGIVVSIMEHFPFEEAAVQLQPGDTVVVYSDGIPEAMNAEKELYGEERLTEVLVKNHHLAPIDLIDTIISAAKSFAGRTPQSDDMTIIVVKRKPLA